MVNKSAPRRTVSKVEPEQLSVTSLSSEDLMAAEDREFILIIGKDGVGKSTALISIAIQAEALNPDAKFYVIDTENGFRKVYKAFGENAPRNVVYYGCGDMDQVLDAFGQIRERIKVGDWVAVESMSRIWDYCQDLGYMAVSGVTKTQYLKKQKQIGGGPTPHPDMLWPITKHAHDSSFVDMMCEWVDKNVVWTSTMAKARANNTRENKDRADFRMEYGIDSNVDGAPRLPYYPDTLCVLSRKRGKVMCQVLKDRGAIQWVGGKPEFEIENREDFATNLYIFRNEPAG